MIFQTVVYCIVLVLLLVLLILKDKLCKAQAKLINEYSDLTKEQQTLIKNLWSLNKLKDALIALKGGKNEASN